MRTVAFYLPQYHRIPENDQWWGKGFTEWTNVRRTRPAYAGHQHPRIPTLLGEYDLTSRDVLASQSGLARENGIDAFCIYFYWFSGKRLLERPLEAWRQDSTLLPYCISWANESWTRRWDGKQHDVLMNQGYERGFAERLMKDVLTHFKAPHYLRQDGVPILLVHRATLIPNVREVAYRLRGLATAEGFDGIHLVASETTPGLRPDNIGFDAVAEFPPVGANTLRVAETRPVAELNKGFQGRLMSYDKLAQRYMSRPSPRFTRYRGVAPGWDNSARRSLKATIYVGATPADYAKWLQVARAQEQEARGERGIVFVNAWNEWAEGAYLEPDAQYGDQYLRATAPGYVVHPTPTDPRPRGRWTVAQIRSITRAMAGSGLSAYRQARENGFK